MELLSQFLLRLAFGLATGMAITSPRQVASGYFRNHLYVTLGLTTLAALVLSQVSASASCLAGISALLSFLGAACWLYEAKRAGAIMLWLVAISALSAALVGQPMTTNIGYGPLVLRSLAIVTSGLVLGITMAAMLLGHWYLNAPGMELAPLRRLLTAAGAALVAQALLSGFGLAAEGSSQSEFSVTWLLFVILRWSFGLIGVAALLWMARETLKIPNTQSATGILYVAVIGAFVGELTALLLSAESVFPL
jgi:hypothetical protein